MKFKKIKLLKEGDVLNHKRYLACKFVGLMDEFNNAVILMPITAAGQEKLKSDAGIDNGAVNFIETNYGLLSQ